MDVAVGAAKPRARHADLARADKTAVRRHHARVQRRRTGDELEHTAGLIQVADGLVAPLGLLGSLQRRAALLAGQRVHGGALFFVNDRARVVGVIVGLGGHCQNRPGVDVHDNADSARGNVVFVHGGSDGAFQDVLDVGVDGQGQAAAGLRFDQGAVMLRHIVAPGVFGGQDTAVLPGQGLVVFKFQPPEPGVVHIGKAEQAAHEIAFGIDAAGVLADLDALGPVFPAPAAHGVRRRAVHAAAQKAVVRAALAEFFKHLRLVQFEDLAERGGRRGDKRILQLPRGGADGPAGLAGRQQRAVGGINFAARRGYDGIAQLLVRRAFGIAAGVHHLQNKQTHQQPAKAQGRHRCGKHPRAGADVPVQPRQHRTRRAALPPFASSHHAAPLPPSICEKSGAVCPFCVIQAKRARRSWLLAASAPGAGRLLRIIGR